MGSFCRKWKMLPWVAALLAMNGGLALAQSSWTTLGPVPRYGHTAAYDAATDKIIVFGGQANGSVLLNDVWYATSVTPNANTAALGLTWAQGSPRGTAPSARFGHTALYSAVMNRLLVFGGSTSTTMSGTCVNDYWALNGANGTGTSYSWSKAAPTGTAPSARMGHTAVYDSANDIMVVFGGYDCAGHYLADVFVMQNAAGISGKPSWSALTVSGSGPAAREFATAVYDPGTNRMIVYGGDQGSSPMGDVWVLNNANGRGGTASWTQLSPTGLAPTARSGHVAFYDPTNNRMTISGGYSGTAVVADSWVLVNANNSTTPNWTQLGATAIGNVPPRRFHTMVYVPAINTAVTFGGVSNAIISSMSIDDHSFVLTLANGLP